MQTEGKEYPDQRSARVDEIRMTVEELQAKHPEYYVHGYIKDNGEVRLMIAAPDHGIRVASGDGDEKLRF